MSPLNLKLFQYCFILLVLHSTLWAQINCEAQVQKARELSWSKEFDAAHKLFIECHHLYPEDADILVALAYNSLWSGDASSTLQWVNQLSQISPEHPELPKIKAQLKTSESIPSPVKPSQSNSPWQAQNKIAFDQQTESNFQNGEELVSIQSLSQKAQIEYASESYTWSLAQNILRYQEDFIPNPRNQLSYWNVGLGTQWTQQLAQWKLKMGYEYQSLENAFWTSFPLREESPQHLYFLGSQYDFLDHSVLLSHRKGYYFSRDFQNFRSDIQAKFHYQILHQFTGSQFKVWNTAEVVDYQTTDFAYLVPLKQIKLQTTWVYGQEWLYRSRLSYSRFDNDVAYFNSHEHQWIANQQVAHSVNLYGMQLTPLLEASVQHVNEGIYNINSSLNGLAQTAFYRQIYALRPELTWTFKGQSELKAYYFTNSDRYLSYGLQYSQKFH